MQDPNQRSPERATPEVKPAAQPAAAGSSAATSDSEGLFNTIAGLPLTLLKIRAISAIQQRAKKYHRIRQGALLVVGVLMLAFLLAACIAPEYSFQQFAFIELFGGVVTFAIAPSFLSLANRWKIGFPILAGAAAIGLGFVAQQSHGIVQHVFLELAAAILLLLGLDQGIKGTLKYLARKQDDLALSAKAWLNLDIMPALKAIDEGKTPEEALKRLNLESFSALAPKHQ